MTISSKLDHFYEDICEGKLFQMHYISDIYHWMLKNITVPNIEDPGTREMYYNGPIVHVYMGHFEAFLSEFYKDIYESKLFGDHFRTILRANKHPNVII